MNQDGGRIGPSAPNCLGRPVLWLGLDSEELPLGVRKVGDPLSDLVSIKFQSSRSIPASPVLALSHPNNPRQIWRWWVTVSLDGPGHLGVRRDTEDAVRAWGIKETERLRGPYL